MWIAAFLTTLTPNAHACGGLFCNAVRPVVQNAERIVFAVDPNEDAIETHVQIFYEGPAEEFAWVVPVPNEPELFVSTQLLFDTLSRRTAPTFQLNAVEEGECSSDISAPAFGASSSANEDADGIGVSIIDESQVGPYETLTIRARDENELIEFLQAENYDVPDGLSPLLAPYVADEAYFVALRLSKDRDVGDIAPLGMRYAGKKPMIPIQLTAIAAAEDMRLEVYALGPNRAVPESYLHVQINEAAIDWWNFGFNYPDVITQAANEAGGHAFATDFAGSPEFLQRSILANPDADPDVLRWSPDAASWLETVFDLNARGGSELLNLIDDHFNLPPGVNATDLISYYQGYYGYNYTWINNLSIDGWDPTNFDVDAATDDFIEFIWEPLVTAEALFEDYATISRMTSSLDAAEMTVDPVFAFNPDMEQDVSNAHTADLVFECNGDSRWDATQRLELSDGRSILLPSDAWFSENGTTPFEFIEELGLEKAQIIEQTGERGQPIPQEDRTARFADEADLFNQGVEDMLGLSDESVFEKVSGCDCSAGVVAPWTAVGSLLGLVGLGGVRRRA